MRTYSDYTLINQNLLANVLGGLFGTGNE